MENSIKTNIYGLDITITNNNIHIQDSYKVESRSTKGTIIESIREYMEDYAPQMDYPLKHRTNKSAVREWVAHNNLYKLNIERQRTGSVDLDYPQKWYEKLGYFILSIISL